MMTDVSAARTIGAAVRRLRRERGWSMDHLAERARLSYQFLSQVETGKANFSVDVLQRIAEGLEMPIPELVAKAFDGQVHEELSRPRRR